MTSTIHPLTNEEPDNTQTLPDRFLRWPDVQPLVGICRSHAHQLVTKGQFPAPIKLVAGGRASAWKESEIREWMEQRVKTSRADNPASEEG